MLKTLFLLIGLYFLVRYIRGLLLPSSKKKTTQFNFFTGTNQTNNRSNSRNRSIDQIEEAEYEDISDSDKEKNA